MTSAGSEALVSLDAIIIEGVGKEILVVGLVRETARNIAMGILLIRNEGKT